MGSLKNDHNCSGALACTVIAYDEQGNPVERIRFNTEFKWSTTGASGAYDIQSVAASTNASGTFAAILLRPPPKV